MPAPRRLAALCLLAAAAQGGRAPLPSYPITDPRVLLQGRYLATPSGVQADIELFSISFIVANASAIVLRVSDRTRGGARLAVTLDTRAPAAAAAALAPGDPNPSGSAMPGLRVATLLTSPLIDAYSLGAGAQIRGLTLLVTVTLLSEWEMIEGGANASLEFTALETDGALLPAPPRPARRLAVLGDSLSSGVGCGFDAPPGAACGAGVLIDDASRTWGALLCANFSAECEVVAGSGITLVADASYNLQLVFPWALGAMASAGYPAAQRVEWGFAAHPVDAVLLEILENDCHHYNCSDPTDRALLARALVDFVTDILTRRYAKSTPVWLTIANHEAGQSAAMALALPQLAAAGFTVAFLNATAPDFVGNVSIDTGCAGHPSAAQQQIAFERARAALAPALGW